MSYKQEIINYYDSSQWLYRLFVYGNTSLSMHHGFWKKDTKSLQEAVLNVNKAIVDIGQIKKGQKILDAGCGVGGTAIYIAGKTGAKVWGITLSKNQVNLANNYSKQRKVSALTEFSVQDYHATNFPNDYFDVVYGIESICYAYPKSKFLKEAERILKPGGKLVIADGYISRPIVTKNEKQVVTDFVNAFSLKELTNLSDMNKNLKSAGLINIKVTDKSDEVLPTVLYYHELISKLDFLSKIISKIPISYFRAIGKNKLAMDSEYEFYKLKLCEYKIHSAQKPRQLNIGA